MSTVVVTWMDGKQEAYQCGDWHVEQGLLWLQPLPPGLGEGEPKRCVPLASVRILVLP